MTTWADTITAITLVAEDLTAAKEFYTRVFELPVHYQDANSVVFRIGGVMVNLLSAAEAPELLAPASPGTPTSGPRTVLTITVEDVDVVAEGVITRGAHLLNGPVDRPWGVRTASFRDPAGHIWEIAQPITTAT